MKLHKGSAVRPHPRRLLLLTFGIMNNICNMYDCPPLRFFGFAYQYEMILQGCDCPGKGSIFYYFGHLEKP
jgi:hypothetical protein